MRRPARRDERGTVLPLVVVSALVLIAVVAFAVDQGIAYAAKARQENALDAARAACMDASFALVAKNAEDPGAMVAACAVRALRDQGFDGSVSIWFYEVPAANSSKTERHWTIGMQVSERSPTVFARGYGIEGLPVASYRVMTAMPYAGEAVWRPSTRRCGRYNFAPGAGEANGAYTALATLGDFPDELVEATRAAMPEATQ